MEKKLKIKNYGLRILRKRKSHYSLFMIHDSAKSAGFSLLETLVALAILTITMLGPMTLASSSIRSASLSHNNIIASFLAEEAAEIVRAERDYNNYNLSTRDGDWLYLIRDCTESQPCIVDVFDYDRDEEIINQCVGACKIRHNKTLGTYGYNIDWDLSPFTRTIYVGFSTSDPYGLKEVKVYVVVEWEERFLGTPTSITLDTSLFNWK